MPSDRKSSLAPLTLVSQKKKVKFWKSAFVSPFQFSLSRKYRKSSTYIRKLYTQSGVRKKIASKVDKNLKFYRYFKYLYLSNIK